MQKFFKVEGGGSRAKGVLKAVGANRVKEVFCHVLIYISFFLLLALLNNQQFGALLRS